MKYSANPLGFLASMGLLALLTLGCSDSGDGTWLTSIPPEDFSGMWTSNGVIESNDCDPSLNGTIISEIWDIQQTGINLSMNFFDSCGNLGRDTGDFNNGNLFSDPAKPLDGFVNGNLFTVSDFEETVSIGIALCVDGPDDGMVCTPSEPCEDPGTCEDCFAQMSVSSNHRLNGSRIMEEFSLTIEPIGPCGVNQICAEIRLGNLRISSTADRCPPADCSFLVCP